MSPGSATRPSTATSGRTDDRVGSRPGPRTVHGSDTSRDVDNGTEFHGYKTIEAATGARFYFATPHHSWERGTCESTNGLLRQYLPKKKSIAHVSQADWATTSLVASTNRPRKRLDYLTPAEGYELHTNS